MDWEAARPLAGFGGGLLIGLAGALMLLGLGRIAGVSGLAARALGFMSAGVPRWVAVAFIVGLPLGAAVLQALKGEVAVRMPTSLALLAVAGLLVGYGTRLGGGCTSGHGVCGMSRLSRRSLIATAIFMGTGIATVALMRIAGAGG